MVTKEYTGKGRKTKFVRFMFFGSLLVLLASNISTGNAQTWVEDTFEDFNDGIFDASGNNIYVSRDGRIRTIHRFDYNDDGYIDLLFCQTHDSVNVIPATLAEISADGNLQESELAVEGSLQAVAADLNHDGYIDLIFCPNYKGVQNVRRFVTIIYGGDDGWPAYRSTGALPVHDMKAVAIADLNRDGWEDIVTLNGQAWTPNQPKGNIIRIFWGSERGFLNTRYHDEGISEAIGITSGDFDKDGSADVAVLKSDSTVNILWATKPKGSETAFETSSLALPKGQVQCIASGDCNNDGATDILIGTARKALYVIPAGNGRAWGQIQEIDCFQASNIDVGDIDGDGYNDIVLSYFSQKQAAMGEFMGAEKGSGEAAHILWGSSDGFSRIRSTDIEAKNLSASAIGDFDGDGNVDIAIAINRGELDFTTQSVIYYGKGNRQFRKSKDGITTIGAMHILAASYKKGKTPKAIFCNSMGGKIGEQVPLYLYWGSSEGFSEKKRTEIPFRSGYEATAADFNADGYTDLAVMNEMHGGQQLDEDPWAGANIFWGRPDGLDFQKGKRTVLTESYLGSSNTADLNRDGYLDLVLGQYIVEDFKSSVIIYYGSKEGFTRDHRVTIPCTGRSLSIQLADYDKDGWLDIAVNSYNEVGIRIFYGSKEGFDFNRRVELDAPAVCDNETADLNGDGWLDIIACCYNDIANNEHHDMGLFIFWGSAKGFNHANSQWLPGMTPLGPVVADFDSDGYLDIFCPSYHGDLTREALPCYLYWGGAKGFQTRNRTILINDSGSHGLAADFDKDGRIDLAVANHAVDGSHYTFSKIFYNDGNRFQNPRIEKIPTHGPHWSGNEDMGHIYNRSWKQTYESSIFNWKDDSTKGKLTYVANTPKGTQLNFYVRTAADEKGLIKQDWKLVNNKTGLFGVSPNNRFLQYRAVFVSDNGDRYPGMDKVVISLN